MGDTTTATSGTGNACPTVATEFVPIFSWICFSCVAIGGPLFMLSSIFIVALVTYNISLSHSNVFISFKALMA